MLTLRNKVRNKKRTYLRRKNRTNTVTKKITDLPRLIINKSNAHMRAQIVDRSGAIVAYTDDLKLTSGKKTERAFQVGEKIAELGVAHGIKDVVFDRNGHLYHGRVAQLAEGARFGGLNF